jgi:hypothetical protein
MSELVQKNDQSLFDWQKIIKQSSVIFESGHVQYHLPYHKGNPFFHGMDMLFTAQDIADPVSLLQEYLCWHDCIHGAKASLFLQENGSYPSHS